MSSSAPNFLGQAQIALPPACTDFLSSTLLSFNQTIARGGQQPTAQQQQQHHFIPQLMAHLGDGISTSALGSGRILPSASFGDVGGCLEAPILLVPNPHFIENSSSLALPNSALEQLTRNQQLSSLNEPNSDSTNSSFSSSSSQMASSVGDHQQPQSKNANANANANVEGGNSKAEVKKHRPSRYKPVRVKPFSSVERRNARERNRVNTVNQAFHILRRMLPSLAKNTKRVSKLKILRATIQHVVQLMGQLEQQHHQPQSGSQNRQQSSQQQQQHQEQHYNLNAFCSQWTFE